jgi:hypothetical protein
MKSKLGPAIAVAAAALFIVLALAACGGGGSDSGEANSSADQDQQEAALEYAKCMREHGVDFPDPVNGRFEFRSDRGDEEKVQQAQEACRHILEDAAPPPDEQQQAEEREAALDFAKCMREHGVDMPDPTFPEGGGVLMRMPEGAEDDPDFEEAKKACQPILAGPQRDQSSESGESS